MKNRKARIFSGAAACLAASMATLGLAAQAGEPLEMQTHWRDVPGVRDIEAGRYERGVERLERRLATGRKSPWRRVPILIDLCVGYTMLAQYEKAEEACDAAVKAKWYTHISRNNRGVLNMVLGRHDAALLDFKAAAARNYQEAEGNMRRAEQTVAAIERQRKQAMYAGTMDIVDVHAVTVRNAEGNE